MRSTEIDRRTFLKVAGAVGLGSAVAGRMASAAAPDACYVAARQEIDGLYVIAVFNPDGSDRTVIPLPGRGHDVAVSPRAGLLVAFARRPERFAVAVCRDRPPVTFRSPDDRHFYGHGCFSPDGTLLYATENDFQRQRGVIGIYATPDWRRLGEFPTFGVGPHELLLLPDGETLAVANGGIATDPGVGDGRTAMGGAVASDLVLIDRRTGARHGQWRLPRDLADLSIRHLAVDRAGNVWFGCQWEGPADATPPLLGRLTASGALQPLPTGTIDGNLANYIGSVATDASGSLIAASGPRAGAVAILDAATARILGVVPMADGCGLAAGASPGRFIASSGNGAIAALGVSDGSMVEEPLRIAAARWDNHLRRLAV